MTRPRRETFFSKFLSDRPTFLATVLRHQRPDTGLENQFRRYRHQHHPTLFGDTENKSVFTTKNKQIASLKRVKINSYGKMSTAPLIFITESCY